jgi:hypothetical protein
MHNHLRLLFFILMPICLTGQVIYVSTQASGLNNGNSWEHAFTDLKTALNTATTGAEIWVAEGEYSPFISWDTSNINSFIVPSGVKLYGGFSGIETALDQRNWENNVSVIFNSNQNLLYCLSTDSTTLIDGFHIRSGGAYIPFWQQKEVFCEDDPDLSRCYGGGIYLLSMYDGPPAFLTVRNCRITNCAARFGGGIGANLFSGGGLRVENCAFEDNAALGEGASGGAIYIGKWAGPGFETWVKSCSFSENYSDYISGAVSILFYEGTSQASVSNCYFNDNTSNYGSGAMYMGSNGQPGIIEHCTFERNTVLIDLGGGALNCGNVIVKNSHFIQNKAKLGAGAGAIFSSFINCVFSENHAITTGGGLRVIEKTFVSNCTFIKNTSGDDGAAIALRLTSSNDTIVNCLFWGNTTDVDGVPYPSSLSYNNTSVFTDNCAFPESGPNEIIPNFNPNSSDSTLFGPNNLFGVSDPMLVGFSAYDCLPISCSPLLNKGNNHWLAGFNINTDLGSNPRIQDGKIDIGAYEAPAFQVLSSVASPSCSNSTDGSITLSPEAATLPLDIFWQDNNNTLVRSGLSAGTYEVVVMDANLCADTLTFLLTTPAPLNLVSSIQPASQLNISDGSIFIDSISGGTPPYTGLWNTNVPGFSLSGIPPGPYSLQIIDNNHCDTILQFTVGITSAVGAPAAGDVLISRIITTPDHASTLEIKPGYNENLTISIYSSNGVQVNQYHRSVSNHTEMLVLPKVRPGMYFITIQGNTGQNHRLSWLNL